METDGGGGMDPVDVQKLWFTLGRKPWSFLVVMPADPAASTAKLAEALAGVGTQALGRPVRFVNAEGLELNRVADVVTEAVSPKDARAATVLAVKSPLGASAAIALSLSCDGVLLVVEMGKTQISMAQRTVEQVGAQRFFGVVTLSPEAPL